MVQSWFRLTRRLRNDWLERLYHGPLDQRIVRDRARLAIAVNKMADARLDGKSPTFDQIASASGLLYRIRIYLQVWLSLRRNADIDEVNAALEMLSGLNRDRIQLQALTIEAVSQRSDAPDVWKSCMRRRGQDITPWRAAVSLVEAGRFAVDLHWVTAYHVDMALRDTAEPHGGLAILTRGLGSPDRRERAAAALQMGEWLSSVEVEVEGRSQAEHMLMQARRARRLNFHAGRVDAKPETVDAAMKVAQARGPELASAYFKLRSANREPAWYDRFASSSMEAGDAVRPGPAMQKVRDALVKVHPRVDKAVNAILREGGLFHPAGEGGGFTTPVIFDRKGRPDAGPFVYSPLDGGAQGLRTLAHEMGHAVHAHMSAHLGPLMSDAGWAVSEAMAFTCERLVSADSPDALADQDFAMLVHQPAIALYERNLTQQEDARDLDNVWVTAMKALYGNAVDLTGYEAFWKRHTQTMVSFGYPAAYMLGWALSGKGVQQVGALGDKGSATYLKYLTTGCEHGFEAFMQDLRIDDVTFLMHDAYDTALERVSQLTKD